MVRESREESRMVRSIAQAFRERMTPKQLEEFEAVRSGFFKQQELVERQEQERVYELHAGSRSERED